jgi:hypothetical protein
MKRTLARILLAAVVADVVGTILILLFAATFAGSTTENALLSYAALAGGILALGGVLALPAAALGIVLGDMVAPPAGVSRTVVFVALGAALGAFMGTPIIGGVSGAAAGIVGSYRRETVSLPVTPDPTWIRLALLAGLVLLCALVYFSLSAISRLIFLD